MANIRDFKVLDIDTKSSIIQVNEYVWFYLDRNKYDVKSIYIGMKVRVHAVIKEIQSNGQKFFATEHNFYFLD